MEKLYTKDEILALLNEKKIPYHCQEHREIRTMKEAEEAGIRREGIILKNLFLKSRKGKKYYLVSVPENKQVDFHILSNKLDAKSLGFASEKRIMELLNAEPGCVSPLGILNDLDRAVTVIFDKGLSGSETVGVHPNHKGTTVWLLFEYVKQLTEEHGNQVFFFDFPENI